MPDTLVPELNSVQDEASTDKSDNRTRIRAPPKTVDLTFVVHITVAF